MKHPTAWIALATGITASTVIWLLLGSMNADARKEHFAQECGLLNSRMQSQLDQQMRILKGLAGSLSIHVDMVRDVFELTVSVPGKSQPGIMSIGYAALVPQEDLPQYVDYVRRSAHPAFFVHPQGRRERYMPVTYVHSNARSDSLLGLDMLTILASEVVDDPVPSPIVVNIAGGALPGVTGGDIILTLFVDAAPAVGGKRGACFLLLDSREVLSSGLTFAYDSSRIAFSVTRASGGRDGADRDVVFAPSTIRGGGLQHRDSLMLGTMIWRVDYHAQEATFQSLHHTIPTIALLIGVFLSGIIFILIRKSEGRMRARAG